MREVLDFVVQGGRISDGLSTPPFTPDMLILNNSSLVGGGVRNKTNIMSGGVVEDHGICSSSSSNKSGVETPTSSSGGVPVITAARNQPGYLDLTPEQASRLIRKDSLADHYDVEDEPFARGKYATVRRCRHRATGRQFAAKFLRKRRRSADLRAEIIHEVAVLEACKHSPRIVRLHEVYESTQDMVLLLELACGGELQMVLDRDEVPSEHQVHRLMRQILDGLIHLHSLDVAHLDIKPQNLVLTGQFPDCDVKLCDFGISRYLSQGVDVREILGTPDYVAPEVLNYEPISLATDMWSIGVLLYVLLTGCSPFGGDTKQETFCNIAQCRLDFPDDIFEDISEEAKDLMRKLMVKIPSKRLTAAECLQHPWFAKGPLPTKPVNMAVMNASATTPRTPTLSKRPAPTLEHSEERSLSLEDALESVLSVQQSAVGQEEIACEAATQEIGTVAVIARKDAEKQVVEEVGERETENRDNSNEDASSLSTKLLSAKESSSGEKSCTAAPNETSATAIKGLSAERKRSFMRNMENLVQKLEFNESKLETVSSSPTNNNNINKISDSRNIDDDNSISNCDNEISSDDNKISDKSPVTAIHHDESSLSWLKSRGETRLARVDSFRSMTRATGMQTMPVSGFLRYKVDRGCNIFPSTKTGSVYGDDSSERGNESIFKFRRVFILDDSEDGISPPPSINGSLSSDNSSISDSNSDTISEMSIDSSSDRSSIISLDDSLDFVYGKGLSHTRHYSTSCYNVWEAVKNQRSPARVWPRECNGSFARALSKFTTATGDIVSDLKEGDFHRQHKSFAIFNGNPSKQSSSSASAASNSGKKCVGLELMRERNGNLVVIREVKAVHGSKFPRCSEVKCESVQSRIRRLQVQNGIQMELAKERYNVF